uniref:Uncharacterized protein n=1 Tax=Octopus bimaculoides TaxID=37653 RepID=A0A0L8IFN5_OCTBM
MYTLHIVSTFAYTFAHANTFSITFVATFFHTDPLSLGLAELFMLNRTFFLLTSCRMQKFCFQYCIRHSIALQIY